MWLHRYVLRQGMRTRDQGYFSECAKERHMSVCGFHGNSYEQTSYCMRLEVRSCSQGGVGQPCGSLVWCIDGTVRGNLRNIICNRCSKGGGDGHGDKN